MRLPGASYPSIRRPPILSQIGWRPPLSSRTARQNLKLPPSGNSQALCRTGARESAITSNGSGKKRAGEHSPARFVGNAPCYLSICLSFADCGFLFESFELAIFDLLFGELALEGVLPALVLAVREALPTLLCVVLAALFAIDCVAEMVLFTVLAAPLASALPETDPVAATWLAPLVVPFADPVSFAVPVTPCAAFAPADFAALVVPVAVFVAGEVSALA